MTYYRGFDPRPRLAPDEFRLLRDLVNAHAGLHFEDDALYMFDRRLGERVTALELSGFDQYYKYLRFDIRGHVELDEAVEALTTNETYFWRQEYQLRAFRDEVLPRLHDANASRRRLAVWSAGCSTGEEAYTLAILARQSGLFQGWDLRIIGSDISKKSVATARRGVYRESAFRASPADFRRAYFVEHEDGSHVVDDIKRLCHFGQLNLLDATRASIVGRVDVVFCRNVLIYFDVRSRRRVIDNLYDRLVPGGYLLLGHSESLLNVSTAFELVHLSEDLVYRKPLVTERWDASGRR
jgi:chemotaxis protein methyltransferase CheR